LSVFNHDAAVAQQMIALAVKAYSILVAPSTSGEALTMYLTTVDKPDEADRITDILEKALLRWRDASQDELAAEVSKFLPGLRQVPKAHVRPEDELGDSSPVFELDKNEPPAFAYDSTEHEAVLSGVDSSWPALGRFLLSRAFLHFEMRGGAQQVSDARL